MTANPAAEPDVEMTLDGFAHGGAAVGRLPDGVACFVEYAIPGERVRVRVVDRRRRWARAELVEVLDPSPDRVAPPCPLFGPGRCGGCKLQHIAPRRQAELLGTVIGDQIRRIGHLDVGDQPIEVIRPHPGDGLGYRNRARFAVTAGGHLAYRRAGSHDLIPVDDCPLLTAPARDTLRRVATGWRGVREVRLQAGSDGRVAMAATPDGRAPVVVPEEAPVVVLRGRRKRPRRPRVGFAVGGRTFEVGPVGFFQASVAAAAHIVDAVRRMTAVAPGEHVLELYAGAGLLTAALAADGAQVTAVESEPAACADARDNTDGLDVRVIRAGVRPGLRVPEPVDVVVLDPPRTGVGADVAGWIAALAPRRVTYVSCDPATFARDARALADGGLRLTEVVGIDQFTHTGHVELVAAFHRGAV